MNRREERGESREEKKSKIYDSMRHDRVNGEKMKKGR